jgi:hypothetical protein
MAQTLTNLRQVTRMLLDESSAADWSVVDVDRAINFAYHEVVTAVIEAFEDYYAKTINLDTAAGKQEYGEDDGFPRDFFKMRRVEINYDVSDSNSKPRRALPISLDDVKQDLANETLSTYRSPSYYLLGHGSNLKLGFIPIPNNDGTDAIKLWYVYTPADLSASNDVPDIPYADRYAHLIPYGATVDLLRKGQQEEVAARQYRLEFEMGLEKMKQQLEDRRADDVKGVTDTVGLDLGFGHMI